MRILDESNTSQVGVLRSCPALAFSEIVYWGPVSAVISLYSAAAAQFAPGQLYHGEFKSVHLSVSSSSAA